MGSSSCVRARAGAHGWCSMSELRQVAEVVWEIPADARSDMRVPARLFADRELLQAIERDRSLEQLQNVATLPGIVGAALAMPDIHQGYGFPVGGVARELDAVLRDGGRVNGSDEDVERTESGGRLPGADPGAVSDRARERGGRQIGTMGSGNHFVELQRVKRLFDSEAARAYGLEEGRLTVLIHSGSRGLGHQVCTDHVKRMDAAMRRYGIELPDRQLACAPASSPEGRAYLAAMAAAANFAWANRQEIANAVRGAVTRVLGRAVGDRTRQVYDVAHNVAKRERYDGRELLVHRKGATRAFPAGSAEIPTAYREIGQPVFIPGSMGTSSFVLAGEPGAIELAFGTTCHGAGRLLSRTGARKRIGGAELRRELEARGIVVRSPSNRGLAEEAPFAYKDVEQVVDVVERAGLARRGAPVGPLGAVQGYAPCGRPGFAAARDGGGGSSP